MTDHDGFRDLVNATFSLKIDELIIGQIDVSMAGKSISCLTLRRRSMDFRRLLYQAQAEAG